MIGVIAVLSLGSLSFRNRFAQIRKETQIDAITTIPDISAPLSSILVPRHPRASAGVGRGPPDISPVRFMRHGAKVRNSIVGGVPIDVVHIVTWFGPFSVRDSPHDAISPVLQVQYTTDFVTPGIRSKCFFTCVSGIPDGTMPLCLKHLARPRLPKQLACFGLVAKQLAAQFGRDIGSVSHGAVLSHYGQGRALLTQRFRPDFSSTLAGFFKAKAPPLKHIPQPRAPALAEHQLGQRPHQRVGPVGGAFADVAGRGHRAALVLELREAADMRDSALLV